MRYQFLLLALLLCVAASLSAGSRRDAVRIVAFYTARHDKAHISFVAEANKWFASTASSHKWLYDTTSNWSNMNDKFLEQFDLVVFLDTRPDSTDQRRAFERFINSGGAWMGFHFSAFALTPSAYPQDWDWYHDEFLGAGQYQSNTWRPTSAILRVEKRRHPATRHLPRTFSSSPNEWYRWKNDLRNNKDIQVLVSIDKRSFPLGTGPKPHEIWHGGDYPVVWTNTRYKMIYFNMGHNDIDYEGGTGRELSFTFSNKIQNKLVEDALIWLVSDE